MLHPEVRVEPSDPESPERRHFRHHPPHHMGILQPAHRPPRPAGGHPSPAHEGRTTRGEQEHLLGDEHGVGDPRLPLRQRRQDRARGSDHGHAVPVRGGVGEPQEEDGGDLDHRGGGLQPVGAVHGVLPAAGRPEGGGKRRLTAMEDEVSVREVLGPQSREW